MISRQQFSLRIDDVLVSKGVEIHKSIDLEELMTTPAAERKVSIWSFTAEKDWEGYSYQGKLYSKEELTAYFEKIGHADWNGAEKRETKAGTSKLYACAVGFSPDEE